MDIIKRFKSIYLFPRELYILKRCGTDRRLTNYDIDIRYGTEENLLDLKKNMDSITLIRRLITFVFAGDRIYLVYINGECIHRARVKKDTLIVSIFNVFKFNAPQQSIIVDYCKTAEHCRGKGIFTKVLTKIAEDYPKDDHYIVIKKNNIPSLKAALSAGFEVESEININFFLGLFPIVKRRVVKTEGVNL